MKRKLQSYDGDVTIQKVCSMPFREMDIKPNGDVFCCNWILAPMGNLQLSTAKEVWHGEGAWEVRRSVAEKTYEYCRCDQCPWLNSPEEPDTPFVDSVPSLPMAPEIVNAAYDQTCNLFCNSCRRFLIADQNYQRHELLRSRIEDLRELGRIKELILIGGGDPFSSPGTRQWMEEGITVADKITIWTNGILLNQNRWAALAPETRKRIQSIEVSVDACTPDTYHLVRPGGDWDILIDNLTFISKLRAAGAIQNFRINFVVRVENYQEMPGFVELGERLGVDDIYFSRMEDWGSFSCNRVSFFQVHLLDHPKHEDLLRVLEDPVLKNPKVRLGNLRGAGQNAAC